MRLLIALLVLPTWCAAQAAEAKTTSLLPAASVSAALAGRGGYWLGTQWRYLGSTAARVHEREAPLLGVAAGALGAAAGACLATKDPSVTARRCLDGAVIGTVPAVALAGAVSHALPSKWRPWIAPLVYGFIEGGITAWSAARD